MDGKGNRGTVGRHGAIADCDPSCPDVNEPHCSCMLDMLLWVPVQLYALERTDP